MPAETRNDHSGGQGGDTMMLKLDLDLREKERRRAGQGK